MKKWWMNLALFAAVLMALSAGPVRASDASIEATAKGFLDALLDRNVDRAASMCDLTLAEYRIYENMNGDDTPCDPKEFMKIMATSVTDSWVVETNPEKIRIASSARVWDPKYFFKGQTYFAIANAGNKEEYKRFAKNWEIDIRAGDGYVIFVHTVKGKNLIYRVCPGGFLLK